ncbi:MAG: DUF222 domain-containing protein, partial [Brachybacterium sp.]|uniref:DUF222 domain-containing protein n=1 Tax=Brachybacterium sp. TaxID=1891286 RepID=UPI003242FC1C
HHVRGLDPSRALKSSRAVAGRTLATSRRLVGSMPGMISALSSARMLPQSAHKVGSVLGPATPEQRRQVDAILTSRLDELEGCGPQQWGDEAARILHSLDPAGAAARHQAAKRERHVTVRRTDHGMARITALVPGIDGARIRRDSTSRPRAPAPRATGAVTSRSWPTSSPTR